MSKTKQQLVDEVTELRRQLADATESTGTSDRSLQKLAYAEMLLEKCNEAVIVCDTEKRIMSVNPAFTIMSGYTPGQVLGKTPTLLRSDRHDKKFYDAMWREINQTGSWQGKVWDRRKNGEVYPAHLIISALKSPEGNITEYVGILQDMSRFTGDVREQIYYDVLTGLPNRILLTDRLDFMLAHARRNGQILALLLVDIDRFKATNDTLGYSVGDLLLQEVALRLKGSVREVDALFRLGNDEFAIILEEIAQVQDAAKVVKKILKVFGEPYNPEGCKHEIYMSASIGISIYPHDGVDKEALLKNAEAAMYRAKEQGENSYQHYTPSMNAKAFETLTIEYRLHKALKQQEFLVYYQPQVDIATGKIVGAEALVRWMHPDLGLVSPGEFIPIAEETGLIIPIGDWVLETACKEAKSWQKKGLGDILVAVNLSARQFQQRTLAGNISRALANADLSPDYLELEITESLGMKNAEQTIATLRALKEMGLHISMDDFGTGYSSLSYLKRFPLDTLKIDQTFIRDIGDDPDDEAIVAIMLAMAHTLKLKVVAEGVENETQLQFLQKNKCEQVQGYFFSPPVPAGDFEQLLAGGGFDNV